MSLRPLLFAVFVAVLPARTSASTEQPEQSPPPAAPEKTTPVDVESLTPEQVERALGILRGEHARAGELDEAALSRATLRGLLADLYPGAELATGDAAVRKAPPFHSEILEDSIGYLRPGSLNTECVAEFDAALRGFTDKKVTAVVLDLRNTTATEDFDIAAQLAGRFVAPGIRIFSLQGPGGRVDKTFESSGEPLFKGVIVLVVDEQTGGAAEALAAVLRRHARAMVVGRKTSGRALESGSTALGGGISLRFAAAEVKVDGLPDLCPGGLRPDIESEQSDDVKQAVLAAQMGKGVASSIRERERAQMNEAALVAGTNPEIDDEETGEAILIDRPLQRAIDLVTAIRVLDPAD